MTKCKEAVIYLGFAIPDSTVEIIRKVDKNPHIATENFSWSVVGSLSSSFENVFVLSTPEVRNYPAAKKIFFTTQKFCKNKIIGKVMGFINIILLKHLSRFLISFFQLGFGLRKMKFSFILVHGTHTPFMISALLLGKIMKTSTIILLTDEHGKMVSNDGKLGVILRKIDTYLMKYLINKFDGFILLSPIFLKKFRIKNYFVQPGILNKSLSTDLSTATRVRNDVNCFRVVFAGGLNHNNGVDRLLDSINYIQDKKISLYFYGSGELVNQILIESKKDNRIVYGGLLYGSNLAEALLSADLLINPRPISEEYSKTSFPSKLIDYMATGVCTLTTKIVSIPAEISDYLFFIEGEDSISIAKAIIKTKQIPLETRISYGEQAKKHITELYSEESFGKKTYQLLKKIRK